MTAAALALFCHHGSPGTIRDFEELASRLPEARVVALARGANPPEAPDGSARVHLGYSWGSLLALRDAANSPQSRGLILVAPFVGPSTPMNPLLRALARLVAPLPISLLGKGIIEKFLVKTASPAAVPPSYRKLASELSKTETLVGAVFEKHDLTFDAAAAAATLRQRKMPVLIISGRKDAVDGAGEALEFYRSTLAPQKDIVIENGGHALLWTHTPEVAQGISDFLETLKGG